MKNSVWTLAVLSALIAGSRQATAADDVLFPAPFLSYATGMNPYSVAIGDLNGDGKPDLATANFCWSCAVGDPGNSVSVLLGNGDGTFGPRANFATGRGPNSVAIGDLNHDGKPDLALANEGSSTVSVLLGRGDGTFAARRDFGDTGTNPHCVVIWDLNLDGNPDLTMSSGGGISVLLGHGDGTFDRSVNLSVNGGGYAVAVGDLSGDGLPDVVTANIGGWPDFAGSVSILMGNPHGWYSGRTDYPTDRETRWVAVGDLNGDRKLDLAAVNLDFGSISVLLGNGDGTFGPTNNIGTSWPPVFVATGDLNRDGNLDLAVVSEGTVSVHLGRGDGTFEPRQDYGRWWRAHSLAIGDLNGDGWPDLAVVDMQSSAVTVLLNRGAPAEISFDLEPGTLNRSSGGRWVTGFLEPLPPLAAGDIDVSSIRLNGSVPIDSSAGWTIGDRDNDGVPDLKVKFDRAAVGLTVSEGDSVPVTVTGTIAGRPFSGTDAIRVLGEKPRTPIAGRFVVAASEEPADRGRREPELALGISARASSARGPLRAEFALQDGSPARLELMDVAGRVIISKQVGSMGPGHHSLDLASDRSLPPGIYLLRITQDGREVRARTAVLR